MPPRSSSPRFGAEQGEGYVIVQADKGRPSGKIIISAHGCGIRRDAHRVKRFDLPEGVVVHFYNPAETKLKTGYEIDRRMMTDVTGVLLDRFPPLESEVVDSPDYDLGSFELTGGAERPLDGIVLATFKAWEAGKEARDVLVIDEGVWLNFEALTHALKRRGYTQIHCLFCRHYVDDAPIFHIDGLPRYRDGVGGKRKRLPVPPPKPPRVSGQGIMAAWHALGSQKR